MFYVAIACLRKSYRFCFHLVVFALLNIISNCADAKKPDVKSEIAETTLSGYIQVQFKVTNEADVTPQKTFTINNGCVQIKSELTKSISSLIEINATTKGIDTRDVYIRYNLSPWLSINAGQMKKPFSFAQLESPRKAIMIDRPFCVQQSFDDYLGRDVGLMANLKIQKKLEVAFGAFNGAGSGSKAVVDNDNLKDFVGRVEFVPVKYLNIAINASSHGLTSKEVEKRVNAYGLDIRFSNRNLNIITECLFGDKSDVKVDEKMLGFYITSAYKQKVDNFAGIKFGEIGARFEFIDNDRSAESNAVTSITPYIGIYFDQYANLKLCPVIRLPQQGDTIIEVKVQAQSEF